MPKVITIEIEGMSTAVSTPDEDVSAQDVAVGAASLIHFLVDSGVPLDVVLGSLGDAVQGQIDDLAQGDPASGIQKLLDEANNTGDDTEEHD